MPCDSSGYPDPARIHLDRVVPILCWLCERITRTDPLAFRENVQLAAWWDEHLQEDRKRIEREDRQAEIQKTRAEALAKLIPEELAALSGWR